MTLRDALLPVFRVAARQKMQTLGLRQTRVLVRTRTWSGGKVGAGAGVVSDLEIFPRPKVTEVSQRELEITKITPKHSTGGYTVEQLNPTTDKGVEFYYVTIGPDGTERYWVPTSLSKAKNFTYSLRLAALTRKVPF